MLPPETYEYFYLVARCIETQLELFKRRALHEIETENTIERGPMLDAEWAPLTPPLVHFPVSGKTIERCSDTWTRKNWVNRSLLGAIKLYDTTLKSEGSAQGTSNETPSGDNSLFFSRSYFRRVSLRTLFPREIIISRLLDRKGYGLSRRLTPFRLPSPVRETTVVRESRTRNIISIWTFVGRVSSSTRTSLVREDISREENLRRWNLR